MLPALKTKILDICPLVSKAVAVAPVPLPFVKAIVGAVLYPKPCCVTVMAETTPSVLSKLT